jgi:DNA helicase-2/ATP-dependent DNA helicase PcrA
MSSLLDSFSLNVNQRLAIEWDGGPLLVLAGPGSGKTLVLILRIARILADGAGKRFRILGLTFTTKAAAEMRDRLNQLVPELADRTFLTTFHSFAADVLRQHGSHVGLSPDFTIIGDDADREEVLKDVIREDAADTDGFDEQDVRLLPLLTNLLEKLVPEDEVQLRIRDPLLATKLARLYRAYRQHLVSHNILDYPALLAFAHDVLERFPIIAEQIRTIYPHICVDEFQDTNLAQYLFLRDIVGNAPNDFFVVADDDQIIYQWNGASPERLRELRDDYNMRVVQLPMNYRCPPSVIRLANNLIRYNAARSPEKQPLAAAKAREVQEVVRLKAFDSPEEEAQWIADDIIQRHRDSFGTCAVLGRTRVFVERAAKILNDAGVAAAVVVKKTDFASAPLRWLVALLRLANARADKEQVRKLSRAFYEIEGIDIRPQDVTAASSADGGDYLRSWLHEALAREEIHPETRSLIKELEKGLADRLEFQTAIPAVFRWFDVLKTTMSPGDEGFAEYDEERQIWSDLSNAIYQRFAGEITLNAFLQEFDLSPKVAPIPGDAVRCFTIHTSKGMEFEHVYLMGMAEDILPSFQSIKKGDQSLEMQEERRNCFVAVTRARSDITFTYSESYYGYPKKPSRFLVEMGLVP